MSAAYAARFRRLLVLIPYLAKHGPRGVPVEEAARFVGCRDDAELALDLELLNELELPFGETLEYLDIEIENGRVALHGPPKFREPPRLRVEEGAALLAAVRVLGDALGKPMDAAVRKLRRALPPGIEDQVEALARTEDIETRAAPPCRDALVEAAERCVEVELDYFAASHGEVKTYVLEPRQVWLNKGQWYLAAWHVAKEAERLFRLDRVKAVRVGTRRFEPRPAPPSPAGERGSVYIPSGEERPVEIRFSAKLAPLVKERWLDALQEHPDGSMTVRANLAITPYLASWVLGYGGEAVIVGPPEARALFERRVEELRAVYA